MSLEPLSSAPQRLDPPAAVALLTLLLALLWTVPTRAGEEELQITIGPGYAALPEVGEGLDGVGGGAEVSYGLSAYWGLAAGAFFGHHFGDTLEVGDETRVFAPTNVTSIWVGPRFNLDVFVVVPFVSLAPELLLTDGELQEDQEELDYGLRMTVGFDYRPVRQWSAGLELDYHAFLRDPLTYPVFVTVLLRLSFHHDFGAL